MPPNNAIRTSKNALMLLSGTLIRMVASFAFVLYLAKTVGVATFGQFAIATHYFELFLSLTSTAAAILLTRDVSRWPKRLPTLLTASVTIVSVLCLLAPLVLLLLGYLFSYSADTIQASMVTCLALFPAAIAALFEAILVARERAEFIALGTFVESLFRLVLSFATISMGGGIIELMWILVLSRAVQVIFYWGCVRKITTIHYHFNLAATRRMALRWRIFATENWLATIYQSLDIILLSWLGGEVATGLYSAAWKFIRLGSVVAKSFTTAVFPIMLRMHSKSRTAFDRLFQQAVRVMCLLALPAIIGITVMADRIVAILYDESFSAAVPVVRILIWVLLVEFLNPFLSHALFAQGKQSRSAIVAGISLLFNGVATYLLIDRFGASGAALGTVLAGFVATIFYMLFSMSKELCWRVSVTMMKVLVASLGMGFVVHSLHDWSWPLILLPALLSYIGLLFIVQAVRSTDLQEIRSFLFTRATT